LQRTEVLRASREAELRDMGLATGDDGTTLGVFQPKKVGFVSIVLFIFSYTFSDQIWLILMKIRLCLSVSSTI
jgi:hypothetical protein